MTYKNYVRWKRKWCEEHESCQECRNSDFQQNITTLIYNGITDQALRDEYDKLGRKGRTLENMVSMVAVAVHEYANSTSAHDTVFEHRFSPM